MSFSKPYWVPPTGNQKQRELWWCNSCYYSHEDWCGCGHFGHHLLGAITGIPRDVLLKATTDLENQHRGLTCHSSDTTHTAAGEDPENSENTGEERKGLIDGLEDGELERLFEDPDIGAAKPPEG